MPRYSQCGQTAVITAQKTTRIAAKKGMKQVGAVTSADRGSLVTIAVAVKREWEFCLANSSYSHERITRITSLQGDQMAVLDLQTSQVG